MAKPVILTVDDQPQVLNAIERDLRANYQSEYKIVKAGSGQEALSVVRRLFLRNSPVALFLVDQRMPEMTGIQFLHKAMKIFPEAGKVLLTAYADTEVAIKGINEIELDYYLLKPWDPPDELLYPVLDEVLDRWKQEVVLPYEGIKVVGTLWSPKSHDVKDFLARNQIPYRYLDLEKDEEAEKLVESAKIKQKTLPFIFFPEGEILINPNIRDLAEKVGLQTTASMPFYDLIIVGGGPAGLASAVYASSEGLKTLLIEKEAPGGQAGNSALIDNYLGFPKGLSGATLARRAFDQAKRFGTEILLAQEAVKVRVQDNYKYVVLEDGSEVGAKALILATGVTTVKLNTLNIEKLIGAGVYYGAAVSEAANYKERDVFVVGGANSAGQGAIFLAKFAVKVRILVRGDSIEQSMSQYLVNQVKATKNIEVLLNTQVKEVFGKKKLERIKVVNNKSNKEKFFDAAALFIFIGAIPHTDIVSELVHRNDYGFILTGEDIKSLAKSKNGWDLERDPFILETNIPGIFAVGDVRQGATKRVATAIGEGAIAVSLVHQYLSSI